MADIISFQFKGKTYIQDPDKVEQQKKDAGYSGVRFCDKCPLDVQYACNDWYGDDELGCTVVGEDRKELKRVKPHDCMRFGRPELVD